MYTHILVPLDGSKLAEKALSHAEGLAKTYKATIHLLEVFAHHPSGGNPRSGDVHQATSASISTEMGGQLGVSVGNRRSDALSMELSRQLEEVQIENAQEYLDRIATRLRHEGIEVRMELSEGSPHDHIVEYAKKHGVDIIVMCTHGHGGLKRLLLGSTTDRVIRMAEMPVLVVH